MIDRRIFLAGLLTMFTTPRASDAQRAEKVWRIGFLSPNSPSDPRNPLAALRQGLEQLGYVEGKNISIAARWAAGHYEQLPRLATELATLNVDAIVTYALPLSRRHNARPRRSQS